MISGDSCRRFSELLEIDLGLDDPVSGCVVVGASVVSVVVDLRFALRSVLLLEAGKEKV